MPATLHIDFETKARLDLKKTGVHVYSNDWATDFLCMAFAFNDEPVELIRHGDPLPLRVAAHIAEGALVVAHNAAFELAVWNNVCVHKHGWPSLRVEQVDCTMARALAMSLPGSLEMAAAAVGLEMQKDMKGNRLMLKYSKPRKVDDSGNITWWGDPADLERIYAYCRQDIEVERALDKRLLPLPEKERRIWILDQKINNRGVACDTQAAERALRIVEDETEAANYLIRTLTGNQVATVNAHVQLKEWLNRNGVATEGVAKDEVTAILARPNLAPLVRQVLLLRQETAKASTRKLEAMLASAGGDGRLRGLFQYHSASTGRWGGRRIQPQNFPRPTIPQEAIEDIMEALSTMRAEQARAYIRALHGPPISAISDCLRAFLWSDTDNLIGMDFSAIEARVLAWLAGEEKVLEVFRSHGKIYEAAASDTFCISLEEVTKDLRQIGKVIELSGGYQGGVGALQAMAQAYGVRLAPSLPVLTNKLTPEQWDKACEAWATRGVKSGVEREEWLASEAVKVLWRAKRPNIVRYWHIVESAAVAAVNNPGTVQLVDPRLPSVQFLKRGSFLWCKLPSGRNLCYPYPKTEEVETPWGAMKPMLKYMAVDSQTNKWRRHTAYGGLLVENVTQAVARDLLAEAMLNLDTQGYEIVLHVHDEVGCEQHEGQSEKQVQAIVSGVPVWAEGLPMAAEGWTGLRYRKG